MSRWSEIEARLNWEGPTGDKRPTEADLDAFEAEAGFRLPLDYRRFALACGHGWFSGSHEFEIYAPGDPRAIDDLAHAMRTARANFLSNAKYAEEYGCNPARFRRLVVFSRVKDVAEQFAWDPAEVTDLIQHEMAIYLLGGDVRPGMYPVASSFCEFVIDYLLSGKYGREYDPSYDVDVWASGEMISYAHVASIDPPPPRKRRTKK